jgi:hypothetical protein
MRVGTKKWAFKSNKEIELKEKQHAVNSPLDFQGPIQGFRTPECRTYPRVRAAGVRKAPGHEIAVGGALAVPRALWGIERGVGLKENDAKRSSPWLRFKAWVSLQG